MRRYHVTTFGCQMNAHDSERIKGLLEELGLGEAPTADEADVVVFNTCTIREKPDTKLAAYLGEAAARKREDPERVIAVGGAYPEAAGATPGASAGGSSSDTPSSTSRSARGRSRISPTGSAPGASVSRAGASAS